MFLVFGLQEFPPTKHLQRSGEYQRRILQHHVPPGILRQNHPQLPPHTRRTRPSPDLWVQQFKIRQPPEIQIPQSPQRRSRPKPNPCPRFKIPTKPSSKRHNAPKFFSYQLQRPNPTLPPFPPLRIPDLLRPPEHPSANLNIRLHKLTKPTPP